MVVRAVLLCRGISSFIFFTILADATTHAEEEEEKKGAALFFIFLFTHKSRDGTVELTLGLEFAGPLDNNKRRTRSTSLCSDMIRRPLEPSAPARLNQDQAHPQEKGRRRWEFWEGSSSSICICYSLLGKQRRERVGVYWMMIRLPLQHSKQP